MQKSKEFLFSIYEKVKKKGEIDDDLLDYLEEIFPNSSSRVIGTIKKGIRKYIYKPSNRNIWIVMGEKKEHFVYPRIYCSCQNFYLKVVIERKQLICKHILAQIICEALNNFEEIKLKDDDFDIRLSDLDLKF